MKQSIKISISFLLLIAAIVLFSNCKKAKSAPAIGFKKDASYLSADATVTKGSTQKVGIIGTTGEDDDPLTTFEILTQHDATTATTSFKTETLSGSDASTFTRDITIVTRSQAGKERYIFKITSKSGLSQSLTLTLTVN